MRKYLIIFFLILAETSSIFAQLSVSGVVKNERTQQPVEFAVVSIPHLELWATTNENGEFTINNVPSGEIELSIYCLGYVNLKQKMRLDADTSKRPLFLLQEKNLTLKEVTVTAQKSEDLSTSYTLDRTTLDHIQMLNVTDVTSLLPGGKTSRENKLTNVQRFAVNGSESAGNSLFGVAVEVDGIRLSNNSNYELDANSNPVVSGTDTRNVASTNIESIEIITGLPSVEHGDMTNGMVKINTKKGKSPLTVELATKPHTKLISVSKGLDLGNHRGILSTGFEHTKSISDISSPYTSYDRNELALNYSNTFNKGKQPIHLNIGLTGNIGGYNSKTDPDLFVQTYSKERANSIRANFSLKWLLNKSWITNVEMSASLNYVDRKRESSARKSTSSSVAAIHATEEGYYIGEFYDDNPNADIILIPNGYWYEVGYVDNRPINYDVKLKANWTRQFGITHNNIKVGVEMTGSGNRGRGIYYDDMRYAPTWREQRLDDEPYLHNVATYLEDKVTVPVGDDSYLQLVGGIRSDMTLVKGSEYNTVSSVSPRGNVKYLFWEKKNDQLVSDLSLNAGWGKMVKLPSFIMLYPRVSYTDILTFAPGTTASGKAFYAYYTMPGQRLYNPELEWQHNIRNEVGVDFKIKGAKISVILSQDKTYNPYIKTDEHTPFSYKFTGQEHLEQSLIPSSDRIYYVDKNTGIVTVIDKAGQQATETLAYKEYNLFKSHTKYTNGSSATRRNANWIIDFGEIQSLKTAIRLDGNFYYYKWVETSTFGGSSSIPMADGSRYKYMGYYVGGNKSSNGDLNKSLNMNLTVKTHIPAIRLIISARLESSLYNKHQNLSEYANGSERGFVIDDKTDYLPSDKKKGIYGGNRYVGLYPEYYVSIDDMNTKIPFARAFAEAGQNNPELYNELKKLVVRSNYTYIFDEQAISPYFSANLSITKEISRYAPISFTATNFFNNLSKIYDSWTDTENSLFGSSYIPNYYYGLSLKIKL